MQRAIVQNLKNFNKWELDVVTVNYEIYCDKIESGEIEDVPSSTLKWFLNEYTKPVQTFEKVLDFSTCFVENAVMFFKGLKRLRRRSSTKTQSNYYFSGVV